MKVEPVLSPASIKSVISTIILTIIMIVKIIEDLGRNGFDFSKKNRRRKTGWGRWGVLNKSGRGVL